MLATVKQANGNVRTMDAIKSRLKYLHGTLGMPWREIAENGEFSGIAPGTLCSIANGREPKSAHLRHALGLPPKAVPVQPCAQCGQLHEQKATCPDQLQKQRQGPRPQRRAAYLGAGEEGRELARQWDELAEQWGGMTGLVRGILDGRYIVVEGEE